MVLSSSSANMLVTALISLIYLRISAGSIQSSCTVPEVAANLRARDTDATTTQLWWDPPASTECADHYELAHCSYLTDAVRECAFKTVTLPLNATHYNLTQLEPCRDNLIELHTVAADGRENYTYLILHTGNGNPPKLDQVTVKNVGSNYVSVSWELPGGYTERCHPGFKVCYAARGDSEESCADTIHQAFSTSSIAPMSPCTEYNVSVATVDGNFAADGKTSEKTYVTVVTAPQVPDIAVDVHNGTAHVSWRAPDTLSMSCASNYTVSNCRFPMTLFATDCETASSATLPLDAAEADVDGVGGCATNYISVSLVGRNGYSSITEVTYLDNSTEIPVPSDAKVSSVTSSELVVDYYKGSNDCITSYRACWFKGGEAETCKNSSSTWGAAFKGISLAPCSNYTLHFAALGDGRSSENVTTTFLTGPANAPGQSLVLAPNSALLSWKVSPSALQCGSHYYLTWHGLLSSEPDQHVNLPVNATSYNMTGLSGCTQYRVQFSTKGTDGTTSGANATEFYTPLGEVGPITNFKFRYISSDMVLMDVDWPNNSWECISTYVTCWRETAGSQQREQCAELLTGWNIKLLKACVNFTIAVTATTNDNRNFSGSTFFTPGPEKVTNLTVDENPSARTANLSWTNPPTNDVCAQYIQVTATRVEDGSVAEAKLPVDATTHTLTGLSPCTTYLVEVKPVASFIESGSGYLARYTTACSESASLT